MLCVCYVFTVCVCSQQRKDAYDQCMCVFVCAYACVRVGVVL